MCLFFRLCNDWLLGVYLFKPLEWASVGPRLLAPPTVPMLGCKPWYNFSKAKLNNRKLKIR